MELVHNRSMNMEKETPHTLRIIHHSIMLTEQTIFNLHVAPELSCVSVVFFYFKYLWSPSLLMFYSTLVVFLDQSRRNSAYRVISAHSVTASTAELRRTAVSCIQTGNAIIADHRGAVCKLTESKINARPGRCCERALDSLDTFIKAYNGNRAALKEETPKGQ